MNNERFFEWLRGGDNAPFIQDDREGHNIIIRVPVNANFDYLFCQHHYRECVIEREHSLKYAGIYCKADGLLYDVQYEIQRLDYEGGYSVRNQENLRNALKVEVRRIVEETINNDRRNLKVNTITKDDWSSRNDIEYYKKYTAPEDARRLFLEADGESEHLRPNLPYECRYCPERWTEQSLLEYIIDPAGYAAKTAAEYIETHQEDILFSFLSHDALDAEYEKMVANPECNIVTIKNIIRAVRSVGDAKSVTVTIRRGDKEVSFKYEAHHLTQDCTGKYYAWHADATGRRELEKAFGRHETDFFPHEIVRITYGRNTVYEVQNGKA